ncbi:MULTISPECIES: hypothetical protein [Proteus]|uniref:Uncharacterized protein n=1 Tax=Proteus vulgaris TaxID=585 RepID=A0A6G6SG99_PROVU|nr:hypothetical protein [Proteus vulgaris]QIF93572.1 hypothetical protein GTH24_06570 [Proteus vulgaris]
MNIYTISDPYKFKVELQALNSFIEAYPLEHHERNLITNCFKNIIFYNHISGEDVFYQYLQGIIYDSLNSIISIITNKERYLQLNLRSIVENIARITLKNNIDNTEYSDFIKTEDFSVLKRNNDMRTWNYLHQIYSRACLYIHSSPEAKLNITHTFEQLMNNDTCTNRTKQIETLQRTLHHITKVLLVNFHTEISDIFIRTKKELKFLISPSLFTMYNEL